MKHRLDPSKLPGYNKRDLEYQKVGRGNREEGIIGKFNGILATLIGLWIIFFCATILITFVSFMIAAFGKVGIILSAFTVALLIYLIAFRVPRKRLSFMRKLKRLCKKNDLRIKKERGFFKSLRNNTDGFDLVVSSRSTSYYVRFYAAYRRASYLTFCDENTLQVTTNIHNNRFKVVLGIDKPRAKTKSYSYADTPPSSVKNAVKVLLVNPVPHDMFKMNGGGTTVPTGTGDKLYDYTLYTATGFLNELERGCH